MPSQAQIAPCRNLIGSTVDNSRLELVSVLGEGAYGVVYRALDLTSDPHDPAYFAVKVLSNSSLTPRQRKFQQREIHLHALLSPHPSVLSLHKTIETPTHTFLITDLLPSGDLFALITDQRTYVGRDDLISSVFDQLCSAVQFCHEWGVGHRDLKPENVFCDAGGARVVIGDFGLATTEKRSAEFGCGSSFYISPECHNAPQSPSSEASYSPKANDVWSLGIMLINLITARNPWKLASPSDPTFAAFLSDPSVLQDILPISNPAMRILRRALSIDERTRCSVADLRSLARDVRRWGMNEGERVERLAVRERESMLRQRQAEEEALRCYQASLIPVAAAPITPPPSPRRQLRHTRGSLPPHLLQEHLPVDTRTCLNASTPSRPSLRSSSPYSHAPLPPHSTAPAAPPAYDEPYFVHQPTQFFPTTSFRTSSSDSLSSDLCCSRSSSSSSTTMPPTPSTPTSRGSIIPQAVSSPSSAAFSGLFSPSFSFSKPTSQFASTSPAIRQPQEADSPPPSSPKRKLFGGRKSWARGMSVNLVDVFGSRA